MITRGASAADARTNRAPQSRATRRDQRATLDDALGLAMQIADRTARLEHTGHERADVPGLHRGIHGSIEHPAAQQGVLDTVTDQAHTARATSKLPELPRPAMRREIALFEAREADLRIAQATWRGHPHPPRASGVA